MTRPLLSVENLSKQFTIHSLGGKKLRGMERVSFEVADGAALALVGPSGSGKSSVLKCIYRTYLPSGGTIRYRSRVCGDIDLATAAEAAIVRLRDREIGYVAQFLRVLPRVSALDVVAEPLVRNGDPPAAARGQAAVLLERLNISPTHFDAYPVTFSGGEQQRVNIARAVISRPRLLLLDEPTASLDPESVSLVVELLQAIGRQGTTMVLICHDARIREVLADGQMPMSPAVPSLSDIAAGTTAAGGNTDRLVISNARIVLPDRICPETAVWIENGTISGIGDGAVPEDARRIDAAGRLVLPGFIDLHSDILEKEIQPRPGAMLPVDMALVELDKKLAACGITTMYHCVCFTDSSEKEVRTTDMVAAIMQAMDRLQGDLLICNRTHARYEMTELVVLGLLREMIESGRVHFFSIMDHTPGQGQFHSMAHFVTYYSRARKLDLGEVMAIAEKRRAVKQRFEDSHIRELVRRCGQLSIPMASHDDDTEDKVAWVHDLGIGTCEFPVNLTAARAAAQRGLNVLMGAPNIMYGRSLTDNLSGREAVAGGCCNLIGSDYSPNAMLHAVFLLRDLGIGDLPQMVDLVTGQPARVIGQAHAKGSITAGKDADLIIVDDSAAVPRICRTFVRGRQVFSTDKE